MKKTKLLGQIILVLIILMWPVSSWEPVLKISTHPDNVLGHESDPKIAVDPSGNSYVVWKGRDGSDLEIYWVKIDASGAPAPVLMISTHPDNVTRDDRFPRIAVDPSGNSYVVWFCRDGNDWEIYWVKINASGVPGPVLKISTHPDNVTGDDIYPSIAADPSGNSYVVWEGRDGSDWEIYWVKINASGVPGPVLKISTHPDNVTGDDTHPPIVVDPSGNSYVVWFGHDGHTWNIYWVKINASGVPGPVLRVSDYGLFAKIAVDSSGNSYITWENSNIYWVKIDASGIPGTIVEIPADLHNMNFEDYYQRIAVDPKGNSYITWYNYPGGEWEIYWVKIDASGVPGPPTWISTHLHILSRDDPDPKIATDSSGNSYITWEGFDMVERRGWQIYWVKIDTSGVPGPVTKISTHPENVTGESYNPQIAVGLSGNSYVTWEGIGEQNWEIYFAMNISESIRPEFSHMETPPKNINEQMRPLAQYRISLAEELSILTQDLLFQANAKEFDTSYAEEIYEKAEELLAKARDCFRGGNYIAANTYALRAIEAYEEAIEFLVG